MPEYITADDFGALARAVKAVEASTGHLEYLKQRLCEKYHIGPLDAIEGDGTITRGTTDG